MSIILQAARAMYAVGLVPLPTTNDGSKRPDVQHWKTYQTTRPSVDEMRTFNFAAHDGIGVVAGAGGGYRETWDFDDAVTFEAFLVAATACGLGDLVARLRAGYEDETPGGGRRWIVAYPDSVVWSDCTLAKRPKRPEEKQHDKDNWKTLIELPTFAIVAPSNGATHPTGRPYQRRSGGFSTIESYDTTERDALIALARSFDQTPRPEARATRTPSAVATGDRPGDGYNRWQTWPALLEPQGWTRVFERGDVTYWRRPGKDRGVSATTNFAGSDLFYPFTSSTVFEPEKSYSKFGVLTLLEYDGDFSKAALALFKDGYGADVEDDADTETNRLTAGPSATPTTPLSRSLRLTAANTITLRPVRWCWEGRLPVGAFALVGGREGVGKTILVYTLAANITRGTLPGVFQGTPKAIIVAATEDSWEHTIAPRLLAAGADLAKVYRADVLDPEGFELPLSLPKDTTALLQAIKNVDAAVVIFDPLLSRLDSRLDSHKDADVRRALEPLAAMADTGDVSVWGLIHVNKSVSSDALTVLMGSRAFTAVARAVLFVASDPDNEHQRVLSQVKNNLGRLDLPTLLFRIQGVLVETTAEGEEVWTGQLTWTGESDQSIRDVLERVGEREDDTIARREAEEWLVDYLASQGGTAAKKDIIGAGHQAGHSARTLTRARQHAGITTDGRGFPRQSYWLLPPSWATTSPTNGPTGDGGPTEATKAAEVQLGHKNPVGPRIETSLERGPTANGGPTEPQPLKESDSEHRWRQTDEAFKKGWK